MRVDLVAACQDTVMEIKSKMMSEVRLAIEDLIDSGRVTREQAEGKLLNMSEYILKAQGTHDYIAQENLPLYPLLPFPSLSSLLPSSLSYLPSFSLLLRSEWTLFKHVAKPM